MNALADWGFLIYDMKEYQKHDLNYLPEITGDDYESLKQSIQEHGYDKSQPIYLYEGDVLDGRNRQNICYELGVEPVYKTFEGTRLEALDFVYRRSLRRNQNGTQKAISANEYWKRHDKELAKVAEESKKINSAKRQNYNNQYTSNKVDVGEKIPPPAKRNEQKHEESKTRNKVAKKFNTNPRYVSDAKRIEVESPEDYLKMQSGELTIPDYNKQKKEDKKIQKRKNAISDFEKASKEYKDDDIKIHIERFQDGCKRIEDNSVDAIITDPPYPIEFIDLWEDMFTIADRILKPSSFLVTYANHQNLDKIFQLKNNLKYYWIFKLDFTAKPIAMGRNLIASWKPVIIYQKLPFKKMEQTIEDKVKETKDFNYNERDYHDLNWAQSLGNFEYLIDKFSKPGDLIVEPFAGTGTTLVACKNTKRKCIGFEIEQKYEQMIKGRIAKGQ